MDSDDPYGVDALPKLDAVFDYPQRLTALAGAARTLATAGARYQAQYATTWWSTWLDHAADRGVHAVVDVYGFLDSGLNKANRAILELQNSDPFLESQRELMGSLARFRNRHRELAEVWQTWNQAPTRRDVDEVAETLYELRREVRRLRRQVRQQPAAEAPEPASGPTGEFQAQEVVYGVR